MPDKQILYYIKNEGDSELLYLVAVACIEKMAALGKAAAIKAVVDAGTASLLNMIRGK